MILTDTHTHQYYAPEDPLEREKAIQRAFTNGVTRLFLPNVDSETIQQVYTLADQYPDNCFPMMGLHPCSVKENFEEELATIYNAMQGRKIWAIGEIGIDLYWDKTFLVQQQQAFRIQIEWAKKMDLPIVIHCRESYNEIVTILHELKDPKLRGIFHCFGGTLEQAQEVIELGFHLGIGGVVTYKNSGLDKVVGQIELKHIVLETDAPYLTPVPFRGKSNESSYLTYIAEKIADLHRIPVEELAAITTANSKVVFGV
ncbi:TatD family hydrolase [Solitalea koreensis]|uniref:TatD DNase family protein n=1 Tax=Solitalea koreensis TaxID=543615 RepID=A0A521CIS3_9SPHI|nr:TatD family hydrolase [Solitalea koreensis]SMO59292.1 TatD DNase family protein [Solitalea koreensis]